jgi:hypothetical protein
VRKKARDTSVQSPPLLRRPRRLLACTMPAAFVIAVLATAVPASPAAAGSAASHPVITIATTAYAMPDIPDSVHWVYWGPYPTLNACNVEGDRLFLAEEIDTWKCVEASGGEYIYYQLWILPGHPPGS